MAGKKDKILAITILILFSTIAVAENIAVTIQPADFNGIAEIYKDEIIAYKVNAINYGSETITGLHIQLLAEQGLTIMDNEAQNPLNVEIQQKTFTIEQIKPQEIAVIYFTLKAKEQESEKAIIAANYGLLNYTNSTISFIKIIPCEITTAISLKEISITPGQENFVLFSVRNDSNETISNIQANIVLPQDIEPETETSITLAEIAPKEKKDFNNFGFRPKELTQGKRRIAILFSFTDQKGKHTIDKAVIQDIKSASFATLAVFAAIALVAGLLFYFRKDKNIALFSEKKSQKEKTKIQP